jgi:hypothetical protein
MRGKIETPDCGGCGPVAVDELVVRRGFSVVGDAQEGTAVCSSGDEETVLGTRGKTGEGGIDVSHMTDDEDFVERGVLETVRGFIGSGVLVGPEDRLTVFGELFDLGMKGTGPDAEEFLVARCTRDGRALGGLSVVRVGAVDLLRGGCDGQNAQSQEARDQPEDRGSRDHCINLLFRDLRYRCQGSAKWRDKCQGDFESLCAESGFAAQFPGLAAPQTA